MFSKSISDNATGSLPVDDRGSSSSNHGPNASILVQDSQFEGGTSLGIQFLNISLFLGQLASERSRELHWWTSINTLGSSSNKSNVLGSSGKGPLGTGLKLGSLIYLGSQIQVVDLGRVFGCGVEDDQRVDFEVGEVEVDVNGVKTGDEVDQDVVLGGRNMSQERSLDGGSSGESISDLDLELKGLGVNIANLDTTLVGEQDVVSIAIRVDANVVFSVGGVGDERLDEEGLEDTGNRINLGVVADKKIDREKAK